MPTSLADYLRDELAIGANGRFARVASEPDGYPRRTASGVQRGYPEESPFKKAHIVFIDQYLRRLDPRLPMSRLWDQRIPTLEDNNHLVTPPFHYLLSRALSRPQDYHSRNWAVATKARPGWLMAALGVRLLLTDKPQHDPRMVLRALQRIEGTTEIVRVYGLAGTNVGNLSPSQVVVADTASQTLALMEDDNFDFDHTAIVTAPLRQQLTHASQAAMLFEKGGVRVRAASDGPALIVLPVQFSHSLSIIEIRCNSRHLPPQLLRVNLVQTGLLFEGQIDMKFAHVFGPVPRHRRSIAATSTTAGGSEFRRTAQFRIRPVISRSVRCVAVSRKV